MWSWSKPWLTWPTIIVTITYSNCRFSYTMCPWYKRWQICNEFTPAIQRYSKMRSKINVLQTNERPTWCHLLFYFTYYVLNMFRTSIYPSSGACDCVNELPHRSSCSQFVVRWRFWCGRFLVVFVLQAEAQQVVPTHNELRTRRPMWQFINTVASSWRWIY